MVGAFQVPVRIWGYIELVANAFIGPPVVGVPGGAPGLILGKWGLDLSEDPAYLKVHVESVQAVNHVICCHDVVLETDTPHPVIVHHTAKFSCCCHKSVVRCAMT